MYQTRRVYIYRSVQEGYTASVPKRTTIEIDEGLLRKAQEDLGTSGFKETVVAALEQVVRAAARERLIECLRTGEGMDFTPEVLRAAKEWRSNPDGDW
jgi:Arc/MetJ family transcription regulator